MNKKEREDAGGSVVWAPNPNTTDSLAVRETPTTNFNAAPI